MGNNYYKSSFIFAIFLHATLVLGLLIKFTVSRPITLSSGGGFINATCVSENSTGGFIVPKSIKVEKIKNNPDNRVKDTIKNLYEDLLTEQLKELAELKQAKQEYKKAEVEKQKKQMQKILQEQVIAEQKQLAEEQKAAINDSDNEAGSARAIGEAGGVQSAGEFNEYAAKIKQAISVAWVIPEGISPNTFCKLLIKIAPGGMVLDIIVVERGGDSEVLERSAKAAVTRASPLPVPQDISIFDNFREIRLNFNPSGINSIIQGK